MNENNTILIKIITLKNIVVQESAHIATFPGEEGEFGVMPSHMPMIIGLKAGIVKIVNNGNEEQSYFIYGGVAQIKAEEVNVITEYAVDVKSVNKISIQEKINNLKHLIAENGSNMEIAEHKKELLILNSLETFLI